MNQEKTNTYTNILLILFWLATAVLFGLAYTQTPLYEGNQNTKFLHGLAQAGLGYLEEDWLANTADPLPVFSYLVNVTARINENLFYLQYILIFGVYVFSLFGIVSVLYDINKSIIKTAAFLVAMFAFHSRYLIWYIEKRIGFNYEFLHNGVAGQYLLGLEYQNSVFGVFILLSMYLFLRRKYIWSILAMGLATAFHSAYIFSAGFITIAYGLIIFWENLDEIRESQPLDFRGILHAAVKPFLLGLLMLILVAPVLWYNQTILASASPETWERALDILVNERIPHHSLPSFWLGLQAYIQIAIIVLGLILALVRKSRLFVIMLSLFLGGLVFTLVQILTGSNSLAALSPWRVSVLLVPLSLHLIFAAAISWLVDILGLDDIFALKPVFVLGALAIIIMFVYSGIEYQKTYGTSFREKRVTDMMDFVKETKQPEEVYLIPPKEPDLNDFRLYTGAPTFINWKSHPYKDVEFLEWYNRVQLAQEFYDNEYKQDPAACSMLEDFVADYGITHVVVKRKDAVLNCDFVADTYRETKFTVFAINQ